MKLNRLFLIVAFMLSATQMISAMTLRGKVLDQETGEPLLGATVMVAGTTIGTSTGFEGDFELKVDPGQQVLISYISYVTKELTADRAEKEVEVRLEADSQTLESVQIVTKANLETEANLQNQRMASHVAIENLGVREMSLKGLSNAEDGVKKMTGISIADAGQVFVRGLGDRYSLTTMNGIPVASPNPDNKLIPLDVFPSSAIQNITVSKVYRVDSFGDYSGALIDIATKSIVSDNFFNISASIGGNTDTTGKEFFKSDRGSYLSTQKVPSAIDGLTNSEYEAYMKSTTEDPFGYGFDIANKTALPEFGAQLGFGHRWDVGSNGNELSLLISANVDNSRETIKDAFLMTIDKNGKKIDDFDYDSYTTSLDMSGLASLGYDFGNESTINYTLFYSRNVDDNYKYRIGQSEEGDDIIGSNSVLHIYSLINNQITGSHKLSEKLGLDWVAAYSVTSSDEPDRRQVLFNMPNADDKYTPFMLDQQSTNRYFGNLEETEYSGRVNFDYKFAEEGSVKFGGAYRNKDRDYYSSMYTYQYKNNGPNGTYRPELDSIYEVDGYINQDHFANGDIGAGVYNPASSDYFATSYVAAGYVDFDYTWSKLMVNVGARFESSNQEVTSWKDAAPLDDPTLSKLSSNDLFPALNLKYSFDEQNALRFSASKTVTRPSFIEMAPFKYRESYGSSYIRGNGDLQNGYNYNFDLRYDFFQDKGSDMLSACAYYKYLDNPIERTQKAEGASTIYSFMNTKSGYAAGFELEFRKEIIDNLRFGVNGSYILTQVVLEEGAGIYTNNERQLQGASPYLVNADLSYTLRPSDEKSLTMTLLYSLQGPRIDAVGIYDLNDVIQQEIQELNFVCSYSLNSKLSFSLKFENLMNYPTVFMQEASNGVNYEVGRYNTGIDGSIGVSYKF